MGHVDRKTLIRSSQAALVIFAGTLGTVYFPLAAVVIEQGGTSCWWLIAITFLLATPFILLATWLAEQAPVGNFGQAVEAWLGPVFGKVFLLVFAVYWLVLAGGVVAENSYVFHTITLPATPVTVLQIALLLLIIYTDLHGIETCLRTIQASLILLLPLLLVVLVAAIAVAKWSNLLPLLDVSWLEMARTVFHISPYPFAGVLITLFLAVMVEDKSELALYSVLTVWIVGILLALVVAMTIAVLGCCVTKAYQFPTIPLAQSINIGNTLVGVDVFVYPLWVLSGYIKSALAFVMASTIVRSLLPIAQPWRALGLGLIVIVVAMMPPSLGMVVRFLRMNDFYLGLPLVITIPGIAIWVGAKKWGKENAE